LLIMPLKFLLLRFSSRSAYLSLLTQNNRSYGSLRFKPKVMRTRPLRTPSMLALDHFDFYYGPFYAELWPSIRLGILTRNKFVSVVNRFSNSFEMNQNIMRDIGAVDLIGLIAGDQENLSSELEHYKKEADDQFTRILADASDKDPHEIDVVYKEDELDINMRLESGLNQYRSPDREYKLGELRKDESERDEQRAIIRDRDFQITGFEAVNTDALPSIDDFIIYPRDLKLFAFPQKCLDNFPAPVHDRMKISSWWLLDGSSVLPVLALDLQHSDIVLDMCAAPGGKSLLIAQTLKFSSLVCNDVKLHRIGQLKRGLSMYIPANSEIANQIIIKRKDASTMEGWDELGIYDKVLVDAPCSTDRLSVNQDELNMFSTQNTEGRLNLPHLQTRLLVNALRSVRIGGSVVYSTCTLSPSQNEAVVENAAVLAESHYGIKCVERSLKPMGMDLRETGLFRFNEKCSRGILVLPWILSNFGPMYLCKLQRLQ